MTSTGTVKAILPHRHFGFIREPDGRELFVHAADLAGGLQLEDLRVGAAVVYTVVETRKGPRAVGVRLAEFAAPAAGKGKP